MPSRMDRYYRNEKITPSRTTKNKSLYRTIYDNTDYSNVESIAKNLNNGQVQEIDFSMIQELLKEKEQMRKPRPSIEKELEAIKKEEPIEDDRNYDIRDILNKAKDNRETDEKDNKKIRNIEYDILKNINIEQTKKEEPKDINNTAVLTKLNNEDLSLNLLDDLKSENNTMVGSNDSIHHILEEVKKEEMKEQEEDNIDKSFFTSSLNFTQEDFEDEDEYVQKNKKSNLGLKITIAALIIATILIIALVIMKVFAK